MLRSSVAANKLGVSVIGPKDFALNIIGFNSPVIPQGTPAVVHNQNGTTAMDNESSRNINALGALLMGLVGCAAIYLLALPLHYLSSTLVSRVWPKFYKLQAYCLQNACAYDAEFVAAVYALHIVIPPLVFVTLVAIGWRRTSTSFLLPRAAAIVVMMLLALFVVSVPLDFETTQFSIYNNSVATSYLAILRPAVFSVLSIFLSSAFFMSDARRSRG
jgi:hypothetical protein